jgi:hypothetical protein
VQRAVQRGGEKRTGRGDGAAHGEPRGTLPQGRGDLTEKIGYSVMQSGWYQVSVSRFQ